MGVKATTADVLTEIAFQEWFRELQKLAGVTLTDWRDHWAEGQTPEEAWHEFCMMVRGEEV